MSDLHPEIANETGGSISVPGIRMLWQNIYSQIDNLKPPTIEITTMKRYEEIPRLSCRTGLLIPEMLLRLPSSKDFLD